MKRALQPATAPIKQPEGSLDRPDVLTQVRVCARLGICDETWRRYRKAGKVPEPVRMPNGRLAWRTADIDRLVGQQPEPERPVRRQHFGAKSAAHAAQHSMRVLRREV